MTAQDERMIGRLTKTLWLSALTLLVGGTLAFSDLKATAAEAKKEAADAADMTSRAIHRVDRTERRVDSLLIELKHLPNAVADTLEARERRSIR